MGNGLRRPAAIHSIAPRVASPPVAANGLAHAPKVSNIHKAWRDGVRAMIHSAIESVSSGAEKNQNAAK
jgi:hypothetical protein